MDNINDSMKYSFIYSPRTNYNNNIIRENKLYTELARSFDPYSIKILKKHFKEHLGIINKENFICIIKNHLLSWEPDLPHREKTIIKLLSRLFEEIDINSKGEIEWKDFVNYIIFLSNMNTAQNSLYSLQSYTQSKININHKNINEKNLKNKNDVHAEIINFCFYLKKYKLLGIAHEGDSHVIFYNIDKKKMENFEIDIMETQKEITKYEINEINLKAEKMIKKEEEEKEKKLGKFQNKLNQLKTQINNKDIKKDNDKDDSKEKEKNKIQRIPTPENIKLEIEKINKINSPILQNLSTKIFYPICICFNEESDIMFISSSNNKISAWKFDNKKYEFKNINNDNNDSYIPLLSCEMPQYAMCYDPGYKVLYTGQEDGKIFKWDLISPKPIHVFEIKDKEKHVYDNISTKNTDKHKKVLEILSLSKVERGLLMLQNKKKKKESNNKDDKNAKNINSNSKEKKIKFSPNNQEHKKKTVSCLILINNLKLLCSTYYTGQIILWDIINKIPKKIFNDQKTIIYQVIYNPIINRIYTCGFEHEIYIYDVYNGDKALKKLKGHNASISSMSFDEENNELVSIDIQGIMKIWDSNNFINFQSINIKEILNLENNKQKLNKNNNIINSSFFVQMLPNMKQIVLYNKHNLILFEKGKMTNPELCDDNIIINCEYNPISNNIMTVSTKAIKFWNIFNGKVDKIYEDLMNDSEITIFELDKRYKKCYLGDNIGKIKCYNLINGILLKEFKSHNTGIVNIAHSLKYNILITGSFDMYIRFHSNIDDKEDIYKEIYILSNSLNVTQESKVLKKFIFNENDNILIMALSTGYISYYDLNSNKVINDSFKKPEKNIKRISNLSCIDDITNTKSLFLTHENGEKYILSKINNKYYHFLYGEKLGNFMDDKMNKKCIIYSSLYDLETNRLLLGDHNGYVSCYDMKILFNLMNKEYNTKEEILQEFNKKLIFHKIFSIHIANNSITNISIPKNLYPKIFITISSDSLVNLYEFEKGTYIESFKQISMKYTPVPIAISFLKQNPFNEEIDDDTNKEDDDKEFYHMDEEAKKRKEKILQTIQDIDSSRRRNFYNNSNYYNMNKNKEMTIYRSEIEHNISPPKINYEIAKKLNIIKYSNELVIYNAKMKLLSQINGQKVPDDKSTQWNFDLNLEFIIRKEKDEERKLYHKINEKEKDVKNAENNYQHKSIISSNYTPTFLTNLKNTEKTNFTELIKDKLRIINLSNVKKSIIKDEENEINKYIENHKFPYKNKIKNSMKIFMNQRGINKTEEKLNFKTIIDSENKTNLNKKSIFKERKITETKSLKLIPFTKSEFNDVRFLYCKNEFNEHINEMENPLKLIMGRSTKRYRLPKLKFNY